jgi:hypothetical protein
VSGGPRRLGALGKGLLGVGVVVAVGLAATATSLGLARYRAHATAEAIRRAIDLVHGMSGYPGEKKTTHLCWYKSGAIGLEYVDHFEPMPDKEYATDGWGHLLLFHCPGPVHKHGWDVWSCGPNGIDEQGGGDDILVGEDLAPVTTGS